MASISKEPLVIVAGAGMVGLACALALRKNGFQVQVWERKNLPEQLPQTLGARVSALTRRSETWLRQLGAWERIPPARRSPYRHMRVWPHTPAAALTFSARDLGEPNLGHIVENDVIRWALLEEARHSGVVFVEGRSVRQVLVDKDRVWLRSDDGEQAAEMLVIAEGATSPLRDRLGLQGKEQTYRQVAYVGLVEAERSYGQCAWQRFLPTGPLAFLPVTAEDGAAAEGRMASIVWSLDGEPGDRDEWSEADWQHALQEASQNEWGRLRLRSPIHGFPLKARHARSYHHGRAVLVGDAAHSIHPLAGQGVNLGFADVAALALRVQPRVCRQEQALRLALEAYERDRRGENQLTLVTMSRIRDVFRLLPMDITGLALDGLDKCRPMKNMLATTALKGWLWR